MTVSVVLRLVPEAVASGRLAGEVEDVASGDRTLIASAEQLLEFVAAHLPAGRSGRADR